MYRKSIDNLIIPESSGRIFDMSSNLRIQCKVVQLAKNKRDNLNNCNNIIVIAKDTYLKYYKYVKIYYFIIQIRIKHFGHLEGCKKKKIPSAKSVNKGKDFPFILHFLYKLTSLLTISNKRKIFFIDIL